MFRLSKMITKGIAGLTIVGQLSINALASAYPIAGIFSAEDLPAKLACWEMPLPPPQCVNEGQTVHRSPSEQALAQGRKR